MLIPLGILAASGGAQLLGMEQIATTILTTETATINFSSIPNTYKHLQLRMVARQDGGYVNMDIEVKMNGASSGYSSHRILGYGSGVNSYTSPYSSSIRLASIGNSAYSNNYSGYILDFLDYGNTTTNKTMRYFGGMYDQQSQYTVNMGSGALYSTSAISSISLQNTTGNFLRYSRFSLYGAKG
jgi:hypothetical protein